MAAILIRQSPLATGARVGAASSERGLSTARSVADADNEGALHLASAGLPTAAASLDVVLQRGGLASGPAVPSAIRPGATIRWKNTSDGPAAWRGHIDTPYLVWAAPLVEASSTSDVPAVGQVRELRNGSLGVVYQTRGTVTTAVTFATKASRDGAWTKVTVENSAYVVDETCPALVMVPSGRLICYYYRLINGQPCVYAQTSTDHGATWSAYSTIRGIGSASGGSLRAEVVGDYIALVTSPGPGQAPGTVRIYWSADGGMAFGAGATATDPDDSSTLHYASTCPGIDGSYLVVALKSSTFAYLSYHIAPGGGFEDAVEIHGGTTGFAGDGTVLALALRDDGLVYCFKSTADKYPAEAINARVSHDGGISWTYVGGGVSGGTTVWTNGDLSGGTTSGPTALSVGFWQGSAVGLMTYDSTTSSDDNGLLELWWGGWDTHTWENVGTPTYVETMYLPMDLPHNMGAARTDIGAGATVSLGTHGLKIVGTGADNSYWDLADFAPAEGESRNLTFVGRVNSDGSVSDNRSVLTICIDDTTNRQFVAFRFSTTQIRAIDTTGTLDTITLDLTAGFELRVAFHHDGSGAGSGLCSAWARASGQTTWTTVLSGQAVGEVAASSGYFLRFGGTAAGAVDWEIALLRCSEDTDNEWQAGGFTNPDDLTGRGMGPLPVVVTSGIRLSGYHGIGVAGDAFTVATTYQYAASYLWSSKRPSARWRTSTDNTDHTVVFSGGGSLFAFDWVGLIGTNFATAVLQANTSDSWGSPEREITLSAVVYRGTAASVGKGFLAVDGRPWRSGQFRSSTFGGGLGRRWYLAISTTVVYEIADNEPDRLLIEGVDLSGFPGASITIYGDRMSSPVLPSVLRYEYLRLKVPASRTSDGFYEAGVFWLGTALQMVSYANGYSDEFAGNVVVADAESGPEILTRAGPVRRRKRIAWDATDDRNFGGFLSRFRDCLRGVDVSAEPLMLVEDPSSEAGRAEPLLVVADGPLTFENVVGDESDQLCRIAQLGLREYL